MTTTAAFVTDSGCALIPVLVLRRLVMPHRTKYALMAVLAMGGVSALIALGRYPVIKYFDYAKHPTNLLCECPGPPAGGLLASFERENVQC